MHDIFIYLILFQYYSSQKVLYNSTHNRYKLDKNKSVELSNTLNNY